MANEVAVRKQTIAGYLATEAVKQNVESVVGVKDSQRFISSVVSAVQTNPQLAECTNASILSSALIGHSLKLPQSPQLGFFYLVPYNNLKKVTDPQTGKETKVEIKEAQFQLSYKGYIQLAMRSGQYRKINVTDVRQGELISYNPIIEEITFNVETDYNSRQNLPIIGYYAFIELTNGFFKFLYWDKERMEAHAQHYSASYRSDKKYNSKKSFWSTDFNQMACKTLIRQIISKWGIMSTEMQMAYDSDMSVIDENGNPQYIDNVPDEPEKAVDVMIDVEAKEIKDGEDQ